MRRRQLGADAVFFPSQVLISDADVSKLDQIPEVAGWAGFSAPEVPSTRFRAPRRSSRWDQGGSTRSSGRRSSPDGCRIPAATMKPSSTKPGSSRPHRRASVSGSTVTWRTLSPAESDAFGLDGPPSDFDWKTAHGPVVTLHIVGVIRIPAESVLSFASDGMLLTGPGWAAAHLALGAVPPTGQAAAPNFFNALVRLRHGAADVPAFKADVARVFGRDDIPIKDLADDVERVQRSLDMERAALLLFAGAVVVAAMVLAGQAFVRPCEPVRSRWRRCGRSG